MKEIIYTQIKNNNNISFSDLFKLNEELIPIKQDLGNFIRELEAEKQIFQYKNGYFDLSSYDDVHGFAQWSMTGFCWLSDKEESNDFGITFDSSENLLPIYNKRDAFYGTFVKGKDITIGDHHFIYVTESQPTKNINVLSVFNENYNKWVVLNSNLNFSFRNTNNEFPPHNEVALFSSYLLKDSIYQSKIGDMSDFGIESKIIQTLTGIKDTDNTLAFNTPQDTLDLINKPFFTIDSIYTKDIDDAIYIEKDNGDGYNLYVAIADVSSYVKPDSLLDVAAQEASSSFYLPHKTIHMVNRALAEDFCSLHPGISKRSVICKMHFSGEGKILDSEFMEGNILSSARLSYDDVDRILNNEEPIESFVYDPMIGVIPFKEKNQAQNIVDGLHLLKEFSLTQGSHQNKFEWLNQFPDYILGENGKIEKLHFEDENALSQKMVTAAMLAANTATAKLLYEEFPHLGIFRNQLTPQDGELPKSALYNYNNEGHWGLNVDFYTHFTSPIRRYCDLVVHRLVKDVINRENSFYDEQKLETVVKQINKQQYISKQCNSKAKQLLMPQYFEHLITNKLFDEKINVIDINTNGVVCQNNQLMEVFVPIFKMDKELAVIVKEASGRIEIDDSVENKRKEIKEINKHWMLFVKIQNYAWTDTSKEAFFSTIKRKVPKLWM